jgi:hypothetical protein
MLKGEYKIKIVVIDGTPKKGHSKGTGCNPQKLKKNK